MTMSADDFRDGMDAFRDRILEDSISVGPAYAGDGKFRPTVWHDQKFGWRLDPSGIVNCPQALDVGRTLGALDVMVIASATNTGPLQVAAGSTLTLTMTQGDREVGTFEDVGPTICVKAPVSGMKIEPGDIVARFAIGDFTKRWLMTSLEFTGAFTGGLVDCILSYNPR